MTNTNKPEPTASQVELAKKAIASGMTRGQFIRKYTDNSSSMMELQTWSDAYNKAIEQSIAADAIAMAKK
jgi:hypothetical protein